MRQKAQFGNNGKELLHGDEGKMRTQMHPMTGFDKGMTVGSYRGSVGTPGKPRTHFFSAGATGGGETDSFAVADTDMYQWSPGDKGDNYAFNRNSGDSGSIQRYQSGTHYGIPGAPMDDTPAKYHDRNYKEKE